jgi:ubiquinone/menaquinone biosynthesis C-methylase UbiE
MNYFDNAAATWDNDPARIERSRAIAEEIIHILPLSKQWNVLEYGCGTGLLSFLLQPYVKSIVLADESPEMLRVLGEKIARYRIDNMHPRQLNLINDRYDGKHDLICTQMVLHHIIETEKIITIFYKLLNKDGYLCIADLVEEDGSFHAHHEKYDGHNGFDTTQLAAILTSVGFVNIAVCTCCNIERKTDHGTIKTYPIFLMIGARM